jgi:hypothetical protein
MQARPLSRRRLRILRAVIVAIRPRGHGFDHPIDDDVLRAVAESFRYLPGTLRAGLCLGLDIIEYGTPVYARRWQRFSRLAPTAGADVLVSWERGQGPRSAIFRGLRTLIFLSFYQHPAVLATLDVAWAERARSLTRRRAELLNEEPTGASDGG